MTGATLEPLMRTVLISAVLLSACQPQPLPLGGERVPVIFGGSEPDRPEHAAVVALHDPGWDSPFCTGTLIAPDVVLTAAHCLDVSGWGDFETLPPEDLVIYVGDDPSRDFDAHAWEVVETLIHPDYDNQALFNDIALIRLAEAPTETDLRIAPLPEALALTEDDIGILMNFAGFGRTETGGAGVKLHVDVPLGGLGCSVDGCSWEDDPATQISYNQPDGGPCNGDSGGPMFVYRDGVPYVGGLTSYGDAACTSYGVSTKVDAFAGFIADFLDAPEEGAPRVFVNEVLVNPEGADGEGEWIEILATADTDLSGWQIVDGYTVRHVFPEGTLLAAGEALVVRDRLALNNEGPESVTLVDKGGLAHDHVAWDSPPPVDASYNRAVDGDPDSAMIRHSDVPGATLRSSPGTRVDGALW